MKTSWKIAGNKWKGVEQLLKSYSTSIETYWKNIEQIMNKYWTNNTILLKQIFENYWKCTEQLLKDLWKIILKKS